MMQSEKRMKIYDFLVNRHSYIRDKYHSQHDNAGPISRRVISYPYLLGLNAFYYAGGRLFVSDNEFKEPYEQKKLAIEHTESEASIEDFKDIETLRKRIGDYDVFSFDVFDTLICRPFSDPKDVFFFVGEKLGFPNFKQIRAGCEDKARRTHYKKHGNYEVDLNGIWECMEKETGIDAVLGSQAEIECEKEFCFPNPYMQAIYREAVSAGKKIIYTTDMYLPEQAILDLLSNCGYDPKYPIYLSNVYGCSKADVGLFRLIKKDFLTSRIVHIGDNLQSDVLNAKKAGMDGCWYPNINRNTLKYRATDMSAIIGGAYRGVVNSVLYAAPVARSFAYEYGLTYGGLFCLGYCNFIHRHYEKEHLDKALFLSRDGDLLKTIYDKLFPTDNTEYIYWSRKVGAILMAGINKYDYYRRFIYHKVNGGYTVREILETMQLIERMESVVEEVINLDAQLTSHNVGSLITILDENYSNIVDSYKEQLEAAKMYFDERIMAGSKICIVDIGWAGSGYISLCRLLNGLWDKGCKIWGMIAGTNTAYSEEPDASEMFLQKNELISYMFSQSENRDILKWHDPSKGDNIFWETILSSTEDRFEGFVWENDDTKTVKLLFQSEDQNREAIQDIRCGILDFIEKYRNHFEKYPFMFHISGRDAYAPMVVAGSYDRRYLKAISDLFQMEIDVV